MEQKQQTIVVALIKNQKGEILLGLRNQPDIPEEHNKWEFPGGGIVFGETPETALKREIKEETGLEIKILRLLPKIINQVWENQNPQRQIIILTYECEKIGGELKTDETEISKLEFFDPKKVGEYDCLPNVTKIINLSSTFQNTP